MESASDQEEVRAINSNTKTATAELSEKVSEEIDKIKEETF